jgi:hypothetical protein
MRPGPLHTPHPPMALAALSPLSPSPLASSRNDVHEHPARIDLQRLNDPQQL